MVQGQGSQLGNVAAKKAFVENLQDVGWELASHIPGVGEYIGPLRIAVGLFLSLVQKEQALAELRGQLEDSYTTVREFIDAYHVALTVWSTWAAGLSGAATRMIEAELPAFQTSAEPQQE